MEQYEVKAITSTGTPVRIVNDKDTGAVVWFYQSRFYITRDMHLEPDDVVALVNEANNRRRLQLEKAHAVQAMTQRLDSKVKRVAIATDVKVTVWQRDGGRCVDCAAREKLELDHSIPLAMGGSNSVRNLQLLCEACNQRKGPTLGSRAVMCTIEHWPTERTKKNRLGIGCRDGGQCRLKGRVARRIQEDAAHARVPPRQDGALTQCPPQVHPPKAGRQPPCRGPRCLRRRRALPEGATPSTLLAQDAVLRGEIVRALPQGSQTCHHTNHAREGSTMGWKRDPDKLRRHVQEATTFWGRCNRQRARGS